MMMSYGFQFDHHLFSVRKRNNAIIEIDCGHRHCCINPAKKKMFSLKQHYNENYPNNEQESSLSSDFLPTSFASVATLFAMSTVLLLSPPLPAVAYSDLFGNDGDIQGISAVTKSSFGKSVRSAVVGGAQMANTVDLKWERFSDSLRDRSKCDPRTNRRMFDNGTRRDGTKIGNPVLGALCTPVPLRDFDTNVET